MWFVLLLIIAIVVYAIYKKYFTKVIINGQTKIVPLSSLKSDYISTRYPKGIEFEMTGNRLRIVYESAKIISETKNMGTLISRLHVLLDNLSKLEELSIDEIYSNYESLLLEFVTKGKLIDSKIANFKSFRDNITCPYCSHLFDKPVSRMRNCPQCKNKIIRIKDNDTAFLVTEAEATEISNVLSRHSYQWESDFISDFPERFKEYEELFLPELLYGEKKEES